MTIEELETLPSLLTPAVVARLLEVSEGTALRLCRDGMIRASKVGKHWRTPSEGAAGRAEACHGDPFPTSSLTETTEQRGEPDDG